MKRLTLIFTLCLTFSLAASANHKKAEIIKLLIEYTDLNRQFTEAFDNQQYDRQKQIGKKIEALHEDKLLPVLTDIESIFCKSKDQEILNAYVAMLEVIGHSASEAPRWTFGIMYTCHPDLIIKAVNKSKNKQQLISDLGFGFENVIYHIDTAGLDMKALRKKIENIK